MPLSNYILYKNSYYKVKIKYKKSKKENLKKNLNKKI